MIVRGAQCEMAVMDGNEKSGQREGLGVGEDGPISTPGLKARKWTLVIRVTRTCRRSTSNRAPGREDGELQVL